MRPTPNILTRMWPSSTCTAPAVEQACRWAQAKVEQLRPAPMLAHQAITRGHHAPATPPSTTVVPGPQPVCSWHRHPAPQWSASCAHPACPSRRGSLFAQRSCTEATLCRLGCTCQGREPQPEAALSKHCAASAGAAAGNTRTGVHSLDDVMELQLARAQLVGHALGHPAAEFRFRDHAHVRGGALTPPAAGMWWVGAIQRSWRRSAGAGSSPAVQAGSPPADCKTPAQQLTGR